jgi:putative ABC transport system permease protein
MLILRLLPWIMRLLGALVGRLPQAWSYLAVQEIARSPRDHATALLLVMISLSFAIFTASMAKTLDRWLRDAQYYQVGADLSVKEYELPMDGGINFDAPTSPTPGTTRAVQSMVSLERHLQLPDILSATYVGKYQGRYSYGASKHACNVMGIDRLTFPETAFYRRDFASQSLGALMNALAAQPVGVLIPQSLADTSGLAIGDPLQVEATIGVAAQVVIANMQVVGIYDYFPTVYPDDPPTLITNLDALFGGPDAVTDVNVWLRLNPATDIGTLLHDMRGMAARDALSVDVQGDALDTVREAMRRPEWVGLFGVLNVGFLLTGLLPGIGFLLYAFAALRKRLIQFGILQALGLSSGQVRLSLILEQVLLMATALAGGAGAGFLASGLFLPFLQVGAAGTSPTPPFSVLIGWQEAGWLCLGFGLIFLLALALTLLSLARLKINQAIKMGEAV